MSVTNDMVAAYRRPGKVMERHLMAGAGEERALIFLMASCVVFFIAQLPVISREAHLNQVEMGPGLGASVLAWLFIAPLAMYIVAAVVRVFLRALGCKAGWFHVRLAFFWSLLAGTPLVLLNGLTEGLIGPGTEQLVVGGAWFVSFLWILFGSLRAVYKANA